MESNDECDHKTLAAAGRLNVNSDATVLSLELCNVCATHWSCGENTFHFFPHKLRIASSEELQYVCAMWKFFSLTRWDAAGCSFLQQHWKITSRRWLYQMSTISENSKKTCLASRLEEIHSLLKKQKKWSSVFFVYYRCLRTISWSRLRLWSNFQRRPWLTRKKGNVNFVKLQNIIITTYI